MDDSVGSSAVILQDAPSATPAFTKGRTKPSVSGPASGTESDALSEISDFDDETDDLDDQAALKVRNLLRQELGASYDALHAKSSHQTQNH